MSGVEREIVRNLLMVGMEEIVSLPRRPVSLASQENPRECNDEPTVS